MFELTTLAIPAFFFLIGVEAFVATRRQQHVHEVRDSMTSLAMGAGNALLAIGYKVLILGIFTALWQVRIFDLGHGIAAWVALIFAEDLCYYWFHRTHHEVRILWASHVSHHSSRYYNLATALRQSWTSALTGMVFWAPLPLLGFDPLMVLVAQQISLLYQFWIHTEVIDRLGPLETVMNTPSHHRVHHAANLRYLDRNYAGIFIIWDKIFGTFEQESYDEAPIYGLTKNIDTYNPVRVAFHEWVACLRDAMNAQSLSQAWHYLTQPPGWSPDGSTLTARQMQKRAFSDLGERAL